MTWWQAKIAVRRFLLGIVGRELVAYRDSEMRWTISFPKEDSKARSIALAMLRDSRERARVDG